MQRGGGDAGGVHLDHPQRHVVVVVGGILVLGDDDGVRQNSAHGHPRLLAGQLVGAVSLLLRNAGHGAVIGTGARLGNGQRGDRPAGLHVVLHGFLLLGLGAELHDVEHGQGVLIQDVHAAALVVQTLEHKADGHAIHRDSAVLLGDAHQTEAGIAVRLGDLLRHAVVFVHLLDNVLGEVTLAELVHAFEQHLLLIGQIEVHLLSLCSNLLTALASRQRTAVAFGLYHTRRKMRNDRSELGICVTIYPKRLI